MISHSEIHPFSIIIMVLIAMTSALEFVLETCSEGFNSRYLSSPSSRTPFPKIEHTAEVHAARARQWHEYSGLIMGPMPRDAI
jgi:hypothetical protein